MIQDAARQWMLLPSFAEQMLAEFVASPFGPRDRAARRAEKAGYIDFAPAVEIIDGVATLNIDGVLTRRPELEQVWYDGQATELIVKAIDGLVEDDKVHSIILRIDSPGGEAIGTMEAARAVREAAKVKQIVAVVDRLCASGAMYIASGASKIYAADQDALIGSLGVLILFYDYSKAFAEAGVEPVVITTGEFKATGALGAKVTDEQRDYLQSRVDLTMKQFTDAVAEGRGLSEKQLAKVATGKVFSVPDALKLSLLDGVQSYESVAETLRAQAAAAKTTRSKGAKQMSAASFTDLSTIPGASAEFIVEAQKAGWSLDEAKATWMDRQTAEVAKLRGEIEAKAQADAKAAADAQAKASLAAKQGAAGVDPTQVAEAPGTGTAGGDAHGDAQEEWNEAIEAKVKVGMSRPNAVIAVSRAQPELRKRLLANANPGK